jgi:glutamate-ammonia-ligase adenylyltransferase
LLVVHVNTFAQYQHEDAWTWEHQALVRARMIYGNELLHQQFIGIREEILSKPRQLSALKDEIITMREKMRDHLNKSTDLTFDIKQGEGGLVDIEFLAQFLVLANANNHPQLMSASDNLGIFKLLRKLNLLAESEQTVLSDMYQKLRALGHQATMQNNGQIINKEALQGQEVISNIWNKLLLS